MVRKVQPNIERFAGNIAALVEGKAQKMRAGKSLKRSKFQLDRKKQRKLKKEAKKAKRHNSISKKSLVIDLDQSIENKDKVKQKHPKVEHLNGKNNKEVCSLQSEEKKILESADSIRYTKEESEIANRQDDKIIRKVEKQLGIRKGKEGKTPKSLDYDGLGYVLHYKDSAQSLDDSKERFENNVDGLFSTFDDDNSIGSESTDNISDYDEGVSDYDNDDYNDGRVDNIPNDNTVFDSSFEKMQDESDLDADTSSNFSDIILEDKEETSFTDDHVYIEETLGTNMDNANKMKTEDMHTKTDTSGVQAYVPPHLRNIPQSCILQRKIKGIVNRVSTSNLKNILHDIELLYQEHPRGEVNKSIITSVKEACLIYTIMPARLCAEHMLLVSSLSASIGPEFVSPLLEELAVMFCEEIKGIRHGKLLNNIVSMCCYLYALKVFSCVIVFDIINFLLKSFTEPDLEVLLYVFKTIGIDIRKDDPQALKDIINIVNKTASKNENKSSRFMWLIETLTAVKNNNVNKIPNYDKSDFIDIQKAFKTVVKSAPNNLQLSLTDLIDAKEKGRWWLVGAAWAGKTVEKKDTMNLEFDSKILTLAKKNHMNTSIRKNIFCILMSSHDYEHCYECLLKLNLKDKQQREIIHVTMICAMKCKLFNPYYTKVIKKFCESSKSFQITTQFSIWDRLKDLKSLNERKVNNFSTILSSLICSKTISLAVLKIVNFAEITNDDIGFFKTLFKQLLNEPEISITEIFGRLQQLPLESLKNGIKVFMKHFLKPDLSDTERKNMKIACKCF